MIKKILKIKGIGRFDDYNINSYSSPIWNKEFKPLTLIYASNGSGKTTLATIFSSLKGNDELLLKKKAFNFQGSSEIEIYFGDKKNEYKNDKWNSHCDAIEVFDTHFINDNIYTGEILTEHRKNLFEIVIGAGGIELKKAIINNREQQKLEREKRKRIEDNITQLSSDISTVDKFVGLKLSNDIETTILNLESKIKQIRNKDQIQEFTILKPLLIFDRIIFDKLKTIFPQTIEDISTKYLQMVENHKKDLGNHQNSEIWLNQGLTFLKDTHHCPFCLEPIVEKEIIIAYQQYFNQSFKLLQEEVKSVVISLNQINLDLFLAKNQTILVNNNSKINDWEKLTNIETVLPKITDNKVKLDDLLESLTKELEFKNNNILEPVKTETIDKFLSIIEELNKSIENYNEKLTDFNAKIVSYKITLEKENISVIENQLKIANLQKIRQSPIAESLCNKYKEQKRLIDGLKVKDKQNQEKLDKENLDNISKYADNINKYLQYFAPYLTIENLHTEFYAASRVPFLEYGLFVSNTKVKFEDKSNKYHSFKYTLSEGDKSALALSFFFAKLATNINLEEKVIIFDDPIASFDENRRQQTIERLHALSKRVKQLIVLTHDKTFAFDFWNKSKDILPLTISFANNSAFIKEYDIEHETSMGLIKDMKTLRGIFSQDAKNDSE